MARAAVVLLAAAASLVLAGCPTGAADDDDSAGIEDEPHEQGCITIDGEQPGYAHLQDALDDAPDGAEIELCAGEFTGSVVVERPVTIRGEGADETTVVGDVNEMAVTIDGAADVALQRLRIETTRDGVVVLGSTGVTLERLTLEDSGQVGVSVVGSEVSVVDSDFARHPYAAIDAGAASLHVEGCAFNDLTGYGVRLVSSAGTIRDSAFDTVVPQPTSDDTDGSCVFAEAGSGVLAVDDVEFDACTRVGIYAIDQDLAVSGAMVRDSGNGIVGIGGHGSSVVDSTLEQVAQLGVLMYGQDVEIRGNVVTAGDDDTDSVGIAVAGDGVVMELRDNEVSGQGQIGIWVQYPLGGEAPSGGTAILAGNTVADVSLHGVRITTVDRAELTDNEIRDIPWGGVADGGAYSDGWGLALWEIDDLVMSDNHVHGVDVAGLYLRESTFTSTDDRIEDTGMWGVIALESSGTFTDLLVNQASIYGLDARTSDIELVGAVFRNVRQGVPPEYWADGWPLYYYAHGATFSGAQARITDSWFLDSDNYLLSLFETDVAVTGSTFGGPADHGVYASYGFGEITGSTFTDLSDAIYLDSPDAASQLGDLVVADNHFDGVGNALYSGQLAGTTVFRGNEVVDASGYGVYAVDAVADGARLELSDNTFANLGAGALRAGGIELDVGGTTSIDGTGAAYPAIDLDDVVGTVAGVTIRDSGGAGLSIADAQLTVTGCDVAGSAGANLEVVDSAIQVLDNPALSGGLAAGIELHGDVTGAITGNTIDDNAAHGITCDSATVVLDACENAMAGNVPADFLESGGCVLGCSAL